MSELFLLDGFATCDAASSATVNELLVEVFADSKDTARDDVALGCGRTSFRLGTTTTSTSLARKPGSRTRCWSVESMASTVRPVKTKLCRRPRNPRREDRAASSRAVVTFFEPNWESGKHVPWIWLYGTVEQAKALLTLPAPEVFDARVA